MLTIDFHQREDNGRFPYEFNRSAHISNSDENNRLAVGLELWKELFLFTSMHPSTPFSEHWQLLKVFDEFDKHDDLLDNSTLRTSRNYQMIVEMTTKGRNAVLIFTRWNHSYTKIWPVSLFKAFAYLLVLLKEPTKQTKITVCRGRISLVISSKNIVLIYMHTSPFQYLHRPAIVGGKLHNLMIISLSSSVVRSIKP